MNTQNLFKDPNTNWKYVLIVVILTFLVGGGILGYYYLWLPKQEIEMPEIGVPKRETLEKVEVPEDWKTYRNEEYGYEVKYPEDWGADIKTHPDRPPYPGPPIAVSFATEPLAGEYCNITILAGDFVDKEAEVASEKEHWNRTPVVFKVDDIGGLRFAPLELSGEAYVKTVRESVYFTHGGIDYRISRGSSYELNFRAEQERYYEQVFNQMLSTFRFLE